MLYLLYGSDVHTARKETNTLADALLAKKPESQVFRLDDETLTPDTLEELIVSQGLFANKYIVVLDRVFENTDAKALVLERLDALVESENIFLLLEATIDAKTKKKLEAKADKSHVYDLPKQKGRAFSMAPNQPPKLGDFNIFSLTDALGARKRKELWVLYHKALAHNIPPEEVHGVLLWQAKTMFAVVKAGDTKTLGLKPFVLNKATRYAKNYTVEELQGITHDLIVLYHRTRRGLVDFGIGLERFILSV